MRAAWLAVVVLVVSGAPDSRAEPTADLRVHRLPFVPRLAMRAAAAAAPAPKPPPRPRPTAADPLRFAPTPHRPDGPLTASERLAQLAEKVRAQLTLGFGVDGAEPSSKGVTVAGNTLQSDALAGHLARIGYARARAYAFGDAVLGVDGVGVAGISTYFAGQFRITPTHPTFAPVATAWDELGDLHLRAAWVEADGVFEKGALRPLVLRGGRQFIYGPAISHLDGLWASWEGHGLRVTGYFGARVPDWYEPDPAFPDARAQRGVVTGGEVALDLRRFQLRARAMAFENHGHSDVTIDWRARPDLVATGVARLFDGEIVREHLTLRYRVSDETRLVIDGDFRQRDDPIWDYALYRADEADTARRYLDLGPSLPRVSARARAGTVILDNVDVLVHGGFALDASRTGDPVSYQAAAWLETGAAFEVRLRRAVAIGLSGLFRTYRRDDLKDPVEDTEDVVQPLELQPLNVGERNLAEGGVSARFSGGARRFSATVELYARRTRFAEGYVDDGMARPAPPGVGDHEAVRLLGRLDTRGGGRLAFEAWVTPNLRLRTEYDLSTGIDLAPEILGLKSLRVLAEGTF